VDEPLKRSGGGHWRVRVQRSYILDTSAFRAISGATLAAASQKTHLLVSPFCFWELLTHLEDEGQFDRVKGNLMKFRYVSVLDDPWASVEREVVLQGDKVLESPEDYDIIYATLAALRDSASVPQFYAKHIRDSRNQIREIGGCVSRVREVRDVLKAEERQFQEYVIKIMAVVRDGLVSLATSDDRHRGSLQIVDAWWIQLGNRIDRSESVRERLEKRSYVFSSYVLHLAADYLKRGSTKIDKNDFEDAKFCQHLALDAEMTAVTRDGALQRCLEDARADLNTLSDASYHTKLQVSSVSDFINLSLNCAK
jgi:hypothetical protein